MPSPSLRHGIQCEARKSSLLRRLRHVGHETSPVDSGGRRDAEGAQCTREPPAGKRCHCLRHEGTVVRSRPARQRASEMAVPAGVIRVEKSHSRRHVWRYLAAVAFEGRAHALLEAPKESQERTRPG